MATLSARDILTFAGNAGFSSDREEAVIATAIALAESSGNPRAHNDTPATGDDSYGLWQINMIGELGPERRQQFGISENEQLFDPATNAMPPASSSSSRPSTPGASSRTSATRTTWTGPGRPPSWWTSMSCRRRT